MLEPPLGKYGGKPTKTTLSLCKETAKCLEPYF
jgi:hypothetical protein